MTPPETAAQTLRRMARPREILDSTDQALQMGADALDAQGWRPIESVPEDVTHIQVWWPELYDVPQTAERRFGKWWVTFFEWESDGQPTHWKPLPTPPEETK